MSTPIGTNAGSAIEPLLRQLAPQMSASVELLIQQMATHSMKASADSLINQLLPLKASAGSTLISGPKSGVIDAVVLSSTLLDKPSGQTAAAPEYKVNIRNDKQLLELITKVPIPTGSRIQLSVAQNNLAAVLNILQPGQLSSANSAPPSVASNIAATLNTNPQINGQAQNTEARQNSASQSLNAATNMTNTSLLDGTSKNGNSRTAPAAEITRPIIEQALRQAMPQQQPLKLLMPLLIQLAENSGRGLPKDLVRTITALIRQIPTPQQIQNPAPLKQAIQNSGTFFEAKLAQMQTQLVNQANQHQAAPASNPGAAPSNSVLLDIKGLMQRLVPIMEKTSAPAQTGSNSPISNAMATAPLATTAKAPNSGTQSDDSKSASHPMLFGTGHLNNSSKPSVSSAKTSNDQGNLDVLLRQISSQLLASLAKTQINQLESLNTRQQNTPDNQGPLNSWTLEIPILHGKTMENLELRIEQHLMHENDGDGKDKKEKLWTVMLAFDLHKLGKLNVQLKVMQQSVSATVWSQLEHTHREVKKHISGLKANLEKVGVEVTQVDCQLGLPPKQNVPVHTQLVDVRT